MTDQRENVWPVPSEATTGVAVATTIDGALPPIIRPVTRNATTDFEADRIRFRIRDLMIATAVFSVALAVFKQAGIFGALLSFLTAVTFSITLLCLRLPAELETRFRTVAQRRILHDFVWGVCMPIVCLVFDPMFFKDSSFDDAFTVVAKPNDLGCIVYPYLAVQLVAMLTWLAFGWSLRKFAAYFAGVFLMGTFCSFAIGLLMLPLSLLGILLVGIGLLGLTPLITGWSYLRRLISTARLGHHNLTGSAFWLSFSAGFATALFLPLVITWLVFGPDTFSSGLSAAF